MSSLAGPTTKVLSCIFSCDFVFKLSEVKALYRVRGPVLVSFGHIYSVEVYPPSTGTAMPVT